MPDVKLLTELLFGFVETLLPTRTFVRFREHNRYILNSGSVNKVRKYNMSHVAIDDRNYHDLEIPNAYICNTET